MDYDGGMELTAEVAIVGAGPIGIEMAVALKKAGISYVHLDASQVGHTISWFAPGTHFFSSSERIAIAGVPLHTADQAKATREEYLAYLRSVVQQFGLVIRTYEQVVNIERMEGAFCLSTRSAAGTRTYTVNKIVLATGGTARPRMLGIPGEDLPHVSHYFQDPHTYFGKRVLIVGGRNSAIEAALRCHRVGAQVAISYRHEKLDPKDIKYWLFPEVDSLVNAGTILAYMPTVPVRITPTAVTLRNTNGETVEVPADFVLLLVGYEADMTLARVAGIELREAGQRPVFNAETMETNVPGVFVAGTAIAGTQERFRVFIENAHVHVERILAALTGGKVTEKAEKFEMPES
jgi:thioredoxin reductase (NADPH)